MVESESEGEVEKNSRHTGSQLHVLSLNAARGVSGTSGFADATILPSSFTAVARSDRSR